MTVSSWKVVFTITLPPVVARFLRLWFARTPTLLCQKIFYSIKQSGKT